VTASSSEIYDALAPYYREYSGKKSAYLSAVDRFIVDHAPSRPSSMLDVGSGDGVRAMALARQLGIPSVVLSDYSAEMAARCRSLGPSDVWQTSAQDLPETDRRFDIITCLWNVLGHLPNRASRITALARMKALLSDRGIIFFDVNNRHNAAAYGWWKVIGRIVVDAVHHDDRRGDASFDWRIGDKVFPAMGHLFTPSEIEAIIRKSGLQIGKRIAVHYTSGAVSRSALCGQLLYLVARR
jgi:2-polyprenyl-3-methyl-5-hydroxy-6-metoxy-1,4-benzoquinol methylase